MRLHPLLCATARAPRSFFAGASSAPAALARVVRDSALRRNERYPFPAFLLEHPSEGPVLIDTGVHSGVSAGKGTTAAFAEDRPPLATHHRAAFPRSLAQIRRFCDSHPDALVVTGHDMALWDGLAPVYN